MLSESSMINNKLINKFKQPLPSKGFFYNTDFRDEIITHNLDIYLNWISSC